MKRKITAVLLCVVLLLTLSVNVLAQELDTQTQKLQGIESTPVTNEITVTVGENGNTVITETETMTPIASAFTQSSTVPMGYLEVVSETEMRGWAYHSVIPNASLEVHIYVTNQTTGESVTYVTLADLYRSDLASAGYGNGYHGFSMSMNWMTYIPGTYTVVAYAIGENWAVGQLTYSPTTYTVRSVEGDIDIIASDYVQGWVWKPDAPNEPLDVHAYVYLSNGDLYGVYTATANIYRDDLLNAGKGNGYHGFIIGIDFYEMPEERLTVEFHYIDNSGYYPVFYSGYYDNRMPIYLVGMTDQNGVDFSSWATQEVVNYAYNIGTPTVMICSGATKEGLLNIIQKSSFAVVSTHGTATSIEYCMNPNTTSEIRGSLRWSDFLTMPNDYFINTRCLFLNACSVGNETENSAGNNMVKVFQSKGVETVVGFVNSVYFRENNGIVDNNWGSERWAKIFVCELGNGKTVQNAKDIAVDDAINCFRDLEELDEDKQYADAFAEARSYGLVDVSIQGNPNQIVKH